MAFSHCVEILFGFLDETLSRATGDLQDKILKEELLQFFALMCMPLKLTPLHLCIRIAHACAF